MPWRPLFLQSANQHRRQVGKCLCSAPCLTTPRPWLQAVPPQPHTFDAQDYLFTCSSGVSYRSLGKKHEVQANSWKPGIPVFLPCRILWVTSVVLTEGSFSAELCIAPVFGFEISWMAVPPMGAFQASALPKQRMVCRWQDLCFRWSLLPLEGKGRREHFSPPAPTSVGAATAVTIINLNFPPCFFSL